MNSREENANYRQELFKMLDGLVMAPTVQALYSGGVLDLLDRGHPVKLVDLASSSRSHAGYLNVALRTLCSQGWLTRTCTRENSYRLDIPMSTVQEATKWYGLSSMFIPHAVRLGKQGPEGLNTQVDSLLEEFLARWETTTSSYPEAVWVQKSRKQTLAGFLGPIAVHLARSGQLSTTTPGEIRTGANPESIHRLLAAAGWSDMTSDRWTPKGEFMSKRIGAFGVTVSYLPTFGALPELIFGNKDILRRPDSQQEELHVDRTMNVWGSGASHGAYFKKLDTVIRDIFDRPIEEQPMGVADMGCGDGTLLAHIHQVVKNETIRGGMLDEHPLYLVGVDYNREALRASRLKLNELGLEHEVCLGDVSAPDALSRTLDAEYGIHMEDLLHVRSFLDHNRVYNPPVQEWQDAGHAYTGAFSERGRRVSPAEAQQSLVEHLAKWEPYARKFGLLIIELHTIPTFLTRENLGKTLATPYDATHGYSDQYIVELGSFHEAAQKAGLLLDQDHHYRFPDSELSTVSVNLLRSSGH